MQSHRLLSPQKQPKMASSKEVCVTVHAAVNWPLPLPFPFSIVLFRMADRAHRERASGWLLLVLHILKFVNLEMTWIFIDVNKIKGVALPCLLCELYKSSRLLYSQVLIVPKAWLIEDGVILLQALSHPPCRRLLQIPSEGSLGTSSLGYWKNIEWHVSAIIAVTQKSFIVFEICALPPGPSHQLPLG